MAKIPRTFKTERNETYVLGTPLDEMRREPCAGCGRPLLIPETTWRSVEMSPHPSGDGLMAPRAVCRHCLARSSDTFPTI